VSRESNEAGVVIVGAGFAGIECARRLGDRGVRVTLVDRHNYSQFQPLLYQVATAQMAAANVARPLREAFRRHPTVDVKLACASAVDPVGKTVTCVDGTTFRGSHIVLAAGSRPNFYDTPGADTHAFPLYALADGERLRSRIFEVFEDADRDPGVIAKGALNIVVVGGGPTGVEMAGAIAEIARFSLARDFRHIDTRDARVILIEAGTQLLSAFPDRLSQQALRDLKRLGVDVRFGQPVTAIASDAVTVGDETIPANTIIWAAGVQSSPLGRSLGVELDRAGRVLVNPDLSVPGHPEIFVIGDMASLKDARGRPLPGVAQVAMQQGAWAAANIVSAIEGKPGRPFRYRDLGNMATIGRNSAVADIRGLRLTGFVAWLAWAVVHILNLIGFRNRVLVGLQWLWSYITLQRGARLITEAAQ